MVIKKKNSVAKKPVNKTSENKKIAKKSTAKKSAAIAKIKTTISVVKGWTKNHKRVVALTLAVVLVVGSVPTYCYTTRKISEKIEGSEAYSRAVLGWLRVVMTRDPSQKIALEGETAEIYNAMKDHAVRIANVYPTLRNLQVKASVLTPVNEQEAIATYKRIIKGAGKCKICSAFKIEKSEKENPRYYYEIARLYVRLKDKELATKFIDKALEKATVAGTDAEALNSMKSAKTEIAKMPATVKTDAKK
jgi:hypothetical protein